MTIAKAAAAHDLTNNADPVWPHTGGRAAEPGMSGPAAVARAAQEGYRATRGESW
jgi:hypothetical protein